jgi:Mg2+/Co2+ transporter CorC
VLHALTELRQTGSHLAIVFDEFAVQGGIVSMDILDGLTTVDSSPTRPDTYCRKGITT